MDLDRLCHSNQTMKSIERYLTKLLTKFEINKSQFSPSSRISLRQRFSYLAELCQKKNASKKIVSLARKLADHCYKLPERMLSER